MLGNMFDTYMKKPTHSWTLLIPLDSNWRDSPRQVKKFKIFNTNFSAAQKNSHASVYVGMEEKRSIYV